MKIKELKVSKLKPISVKISEDDYKFLKKNKISPSKALRWYIAELKRLG